MKHHLGVKAYKRNKIHALTEQQKKTRRVRSQNLLKRHAQGLLPNLVFSDEKIFTVEQSLNKQNDRVYLKDKDCDKSEHLKVPRTQGPASVMVWAAITPNGRCPLVFIPQGVKVNAEVYRKSVLENCLRPWADHHFGEEVWTFQQDSAPSHKARATKDWLRDNVPGFNSALEWPPRSPDHNPLDFSIWSVLESRVCAKNHTSVESLKASLRREWDLISPEIVRAACTSFVKRLREVVKARGGHIES